MRRLLSALITIIILVILIGFIAYLYRSTLTSSVLSSKVGSKITISEINFNPPHITVDDFKMRNPLGFKNSYALEIRQIDVDAPYSNFKNNVIEINKIQLNDVTLDVEISGASNNWDAIITNVAKDEKTDSTGKATIKLLEINNLHVKITMPNGEVKEATINHLEYRDVQTNNGDLAKKIMQAVIAKLMLDIKNTYKLPLNVTQEGVKNISTPSSPAPTIPQTTTTPQIK